MGDKPRSIQSILGEAGTGSDGPVDWEAAVNHLRALDARNRRERAATPSGADRPAPAVSKRDTPVQRGTKKPTPTTPVAPERRPKARGFVSAPTIPLWGEMLRGIPNALARSALFSCARPGDRRMYKGRVLSSLSNLEIQYTGEELLQRDADVWYHIIHLGRMVAAGDPVIIHARQTIGALGWSYSQRSYRDLADSIRRQQACGVYIIDTGTEGRRHVYQGSLLTQMLGIDGGEGTDGTYAVGLDPQILNLFGPSSYTLVSLTQRMKLAPLGKWLHSFYSTHALPHPIKVTTLLNLCGSTMRTLFHFRAELKAALDDLISVGFLESWSLDKERDTVSVVRAASSLKLGR